MFCAMAFSTVKSGQMEPLVTAALEHAAALRQQPGYVASYVLSERGGSGQVSISIFESEEALEHAVAATLPVIARHHIERFLEGPPAFRRFEVR